MGNNRTYREPLRTDWADSLLGMGLGDRLAEAQAEMRKAVQEAREAIRRNALTATVANAAARWIGRRGRPHIVVDDNGFVMLEIRYGKKGAEDEEDTRNWASSLPPLKVLRQRAEKAGLDHEPFGRRRRELKLAVEEAEGQASPPKKKMRKTAPAITAPVVLNPTSDPEEVPTASAVVVQLRPTIGPVPDEAGDYEDEDEKVVIPLPEEDDDDEINIDDILNFDPDSD